MEQLTGEEFQRAACHTRHSEDIKKAARLILVEGYRPTKAGDACGQTKQAANQAAKKIYSIHQDQPVPKGCRLAKAWLPFGQADRVEARCRLKKLKNN